MQEPDTMEQVGIASKEGVEEQIEDLNTSQRAGDAKVKDIASKEMMGEQIEEINNSQRVGDAKVKQVNVRSVALTDALAKDSLSPWCRSMLKLYLILILVTLNQCGSGFDGSLMSAINAMKPYHSQFNIGMEGGGTGIVFAIYTIGNVTGALFASSAADMLGRRFGMAVGACFVILGTVIQATAPNIGQFMGGRFLVGFALPISTTAAPIYVIEMAYPPWRGVCGGLYQVAGFYIGAIVAGWTCYGTGFMSSNWSWRIPIILQAVPAVIVLAFVYFIPESPRWLMAHGRTEAAMEILVKYHGNGNPESAVVQLERVEIEEAIDIEAESNTKRWWDYRCLFNSRPVLYRVWLLMLITVFSQFIGGSVISYYTPVILQNVGITSSSEQLLINALNIVLSFLGGIVGNFFVERWGRRPLLIAATFATMCCYIPLNVIAAQTGGHVSTGAGYAFIAFIFLYGITYSFGWTNLQILYPTEILNTEIRAKGVAFQTFVGGLAGFLNTYATPIALQNIGWKTYTIFLVLHFVELVLIYFTMVETKGRSLEELAEIFDDPHPVKKSLKKHVVAVKKGEGVKMDFGEGDA